MSKRATRRKAEVLDGNGNVVWEMLAHYEPDPAVQANLAAVGYRFQWATTPKKRPLTMVYSPLDPWQSVVAAQMVHARRETKNSAVLMLLLAKSGQWATREEVRAVGGDSGDRRFRELRERNWPVEIAPNKKNMPWLIRLVMPPKTKRVIPRQP